MSYYHPDAFTIDRRMQERGLDRLQAIRQLQQERELRAMDRRKTPRR